MAMNASELIEWLQSLSPDAAVAIDDGGLTLVEVDGDAWCEVGGVPEDEKSE